MLEKLIYIYATSLVLQSLGVLFLALIFIGVARNCRSFKILGLSGLILNNFCLFLMPSIFGFAYFGDSTRHIVWLMSIMNGEPLSDYSQYTSFYLVAITFIKLGMSPFSLLWLCPIVMYSAFIGGFILLACALKKAGQDNNVLFLAPAVSLIFGLNQAAIMPWHMGVCFIPFLLAIQISLSKRFGWPLAVVSLIIFAGIIFSHPHNFLYCGVLLSTYWWQQKTEPISYAVSLLVLFFSAGLYYLLHISTLGAMEEMVRRLWGIIPLYPLDIFQRQYIIFFVILSVGIGLAAYYIKQKEYLPLVTSFIAVLDIGFFGLAGLLLFRETVRVFAYALIITLILAGLYLRKYWNDNKRSNPAVVWVMLLALGLLYILLFNRLAARYPGIYFETIQWSFY